MAEPPNDKKVKSRRKGTSIYKPPHRAGKSNPQQPPEAEEDPNELARADGEYSREVTKTEKSMEKNDKPNVRKVQERPNAVSETKSKNSDSKRRQSDVKKTDRKANKAADQDVKPTKPEVSQMSKEDQIKQASVMFNLMSSFKGERKISPPVTKPRGRGRSNEPTIEELEAILAQRNAMMADSQDTGDKSDSNGPALLSPLLKDLQKKKHRDDTHKSRHGDKSSSSDESRRCYNAAKQLETELMQLQASGTKLHTFGDLRDKINDAYLKVILLNPKFAHGKRIVGKFWNPCHKRVEDHLRYIKDHNLTEDQDYRTKLALIIDEGCLLFSRLVDAITSKYPMLNDVKSSSSADIEPEVLESLRTILGCVYGCLGDLERYRQLHVLKATPNQPSSWALALENYNRSLAIQPGIGKNHNQLAIIASYIGNEFECVYQYIRSICAVDTFPARENLLAVYEKNRQAFMNLSNIHLSSKSTINAGSELQLFLTRFIQCICVMDTRISVDTFEQVSKLALANFQALLETHRVTDDLLIRVLVMCVYLTARSPASTASATTTSSASTSSTSTSTSSSNAKADAASVIPTASPANNNNNTGNSGSTDLGVIPLYASGLIFEIFGSVLRVAAANLRSLPLLGSIAAMCGWLTHNPGLASLPGHECEFLRTGLAQLVNGVMAQSHLAFISKMTADDITRINNSASVLRKLRGFAPLEGIGFWTDDFGLDFQLEAVRKAAKLLHFHAATQRYSAFQDLHSLRAANDQERAELEAEMTKSKSKTTAKKGRRHSNGNSTGEEESAAAVTTSTTTATAALEEPTPSDVLPALGELQLLHTQQHSQQQLPEHRDESGSTLPPDIKEVESDDDDDDIIMFQPVPASSSSSSSTTTTTTNTQTESDSNNNNNNKSESKSESGASSIDIKLTDIKPTEQPKPVVPSPVKQPKQHRAFFVLDAPNICMRHGSQKTFSTAGIQIAIEYFRKRGHKVLALMPEYYLDYSYVGGKMRLNRAGFDVQAQKMPDNVSLLISLRDEGLVATTPAQDYDDSYTIVYAQKHNGFIISNDK